MSAAFSTADPWVKYLAEMNAGTTGFGSLVSGDHHLDFEATLEFTIEEYRVTKERSESLEKKISKMIQIKHAKARSEYEIAQRNLTLLEKEGDLVRKIIPGMSTSCNEITATHPCPYEGMKGVGRLIPPDINFMNNFSVSLEDHTRGWIDELAPTADHGSVSSGNSVDAVDVDAMSHDSQAPKSGPVSLVGKEVEDTGVTQEDHKRGSANPFSTGKELTDDWIRSKSPEELQEIRVAVERALKQGTEGEGFHGRTRRRLSKKHRFKLKTGDANADLFKTLT